MIYSVFLFCERRKACSCEIVINLTLLWCFSLVFLVTEFSNSSLCASHFFVILPMFDCSYSYVSNSQIGSSEKHMSFDVSILKL